VGQPRGGEWSKEDVGFGLEKIVKMAEDVGGMIAQIATAATEQSSATEQINASVAQISSATHGIVGGSRANCESLHRSFRHGSGSAKYRKPIQTGFRSQHEGCRGWCRLGRNFSSKCKTRMP